MTLTWYGTAALLFAEGSAALAFDPFLGIPLGAARPDRTPTEGPNLFGAVSDVFVTHGHFDHILQIPALFGRGSAVVHATEAPRETLSRFGFPAERLNAVAPGDTVAAGTFTVRAWQGRHCRFDAPLILRTALSPRLIKNLPHMLRLLRWMRGCPEKGEILFYELSAGGRRVQVMGSMGLDPAVSYPTGADALILPFQGRSDLAAFGLALVGRLRPKAVFLDHFDDSFPPMTTPVDTAAFEALLSGPYGIPCRALRLNETITI